MVDDRFRRLFELASVGIARFQADGTTVEANPALERLLGYSARELATVSFTAITHPEDREVSATLHADLLAGVRDAYQYEKRYIRKDGQTIWCRVSVWSDSGVAGFQLATAMVEDVTPAKLAQTALGDRADRMEQVIATQRDITAAAGDLQAVMDVIVHRSQALTRAQGAMVSLIEGDELVTRAASGIATRHLRNRRPLSATVGRFAIAAREPLLISHAEGDSRLNPELLAAIGDRSHICLPLFSGEIPVGVLSVMSASEDERLGEDDLHTLELLSGALSAGVSRAAEAEAERRRADALARFEAIYRGALTGVFVVDPSGKILDVNPAAVELLGRDSAGLVGLDLGEFVHDEDRPRLHQAVRRLLAGGSDCLRIDHRFVRADGQTVWVAASLSLVRDGDGAVSFGIIMAQDVTERQEAEEALRRQAELNQHQALHDALTGLPNRKLFRERIRTLAAVAQRQGGRLAVAMMDLNRFKEVNDSLGHHAGDALLVQLAERVRDALRTSDTVARLGGDEFGVLIPAPSSAEDVISVLAKIRDAVEQPVMVEDMAVSVEASIGIAMFPDDSEDVDALLRHADLAMYCAKESNTGYVFYDPARHDADRSQLNLVGELRQAIEQDELVLFYQPKANLSDGAVQSVEALLRWQHPERGLLGPDQFIPVAERTGLMHPITLYVLDRALEQCRAWDAEGLHLGVAVNLSVRSLLDAEFPDHVRRLLGKWRVDPARLELELTETTMLVDPIRARRVLDELATIGVSLSIDDFGTGYSSLAHLSQLPVHEIKIDRSFVMNMETSANNAVIVRSTIDLARNLGLQVVAEGVENAHAWEQLRTLGCNLAQGYYLTRPVPAEQLTAWLRAREETPRAA